MSEALRRVFLALPLAEYFQKPVERYLDRVSGGVEGYKWVDPGNIHVTLHFFGDLADREIQTVCESMNFKTSKFAPLKLGLEGIGFFPNAKAARIVWTGICGQVPELCRMQESLTARIRRDGFPVESKPFRAHVTVGRIRKNRRPPAFPEIDFPKTEEVQINRIVLYQSILGESGPQYVPIETFPFGRKTEA